MIFTALIFLFVLNNISAQDPRYITTRDQSVLIDAEIDSGDNPAITLKWEKNELAESYSIRKKKVSDASFPVSYIAEVGSDTLFWVDNDIEPGTLYEYEVSAYSFGSIILTFTNPDNTKFDSTLAKNFLGFGYIVAGIESMAFDNYGTVLLLIDETIKVPLAAEIQVLKDDLISEGWGVRIRYVGRTEEFNGDSVKAVKAVVQEEYNTIGNELSAIFILGRVAVPYSGRIYPDGHGDHIGAWPADMYYGHTNDFFWTDNQINDISAKRERNKNIPGDGKFDQGALNSFSKVEIAVGRVDFFEMDQFFIDGITEIDLLRNYLNKDHAYRNGKIEYQMRGLVDDNFGAKKYLEGFASNGWRNLGAFFDNGQVQSVDWFQTLETESYLWAYGTGGGTYTSAGGIGNTEQFVTTPVNSIFTMLFGSYFGDWDSPNNFLRAPLASAPSVLTCSWSGRPPWFYHHMAAGYPISYSTILSQNNPANVYYDNVYWIPEMSPNPFTYVIGNLSTHAALLGDPTLRMFMAPEPKLKSLMIKTIPDKKVRISWEVPDEIPENTYINIYKSYNPDGPFQRINPNPLSINNEFEDTVVTSGQVYYMGRIATLQGYNGGTFYNQGRGVLVETTVTGIEDNMDDIAIDISPIPAIENLSIRINNNSASDLRIEVIDISGRIVKRFSNSNNGSQIIQWDLRDENGSELTQGVYIIKASSGSSVLTKRLLKMK